MLHVNEDNNDELFRKAAEDFFLKAGAPDWDGLSNKMQHPAVASANETTGIKKEKKYRFGMVHFKPLYHTRVYKAMSSFFNQFPWGRWSGRAKKKIDPVLYTVNGSLQLYNYYTAVLYAGALSGHKL